MAKPRPNPKTVELEYEYQLDGKPVSEMTLRPPKVKDSRLAAKGAPSNAPEDIEVQLFANLTDSTFDFIMDLEQEDYGRLQEAYLDFLPSQKRRLMSSS